MKKLIIAPMVALGVCSLFASATRSTDGAAYVIDVPDGEIETVSADDVSALGDGTGAFTELRKKGKGTLVAASIPTFRGTVRVSAGFYQISAADQCGTSDGPTVVEDGATLAVNNWITFDTEELVISGSGASETTGVIHLLDYQQVNLARVTMNGDCYITGTDICHYFRLIASDTYAIDMNGHTMTFETGNNVYLSNPTIVDAGHFACWANSLIVEDGTVLDHGKEHTITIAQGRRHTNASLLFWDNRLLGANNWTIVHDNPTTADGIYCNLDGGRWYGDVIYGADVPDDKKSLFGGCAVTMYGMIKGSGVLNVGRGIICGDNSGFDGEIRCNQGGVAGGMKSVKPADALGRCNWIWLMKTDSTDGCGYTAEEFRDEIFANYAPYTIWVLVKKGDVFDYPYDVSGTVPGSGKFYNMGEGVFQFSGAVTKGEFRWFQPGVGPVRLSGSHAGDIAAGGFDNNPMPGGRLEFANFSAKSESWKAIHLNAPSDSSLIMEVAFTNASLDARTDGNALSLCQVAPTYGKTCMEILEGCAITNGLVLGNNWNSVNDNQAACGFYLRGGNLCVPLNPGVGDAHLGRYSQGYFEQSGGTAEFEYYTYVGRCADAIGQFYQSGGTCVFNDTRYHLGAEGRAVHYQTGGAFETKSAMSVCDSSYNTTGGGTVADMTVSGAGTECTVASRIMLARRFDCTATLNINDGARLTTGEIVMSRYGRDDDPSPLDWYTGDRGYVNFNGGVLRTQHHQWNLFGSAAGAYNSQRGEYTNNWPTAVTIFKKGATIDVPEAKEVYVSAPLRAPAGNGVIAIALPADFDRTTYVAPPVVDIAGDGVNATAVATIDSRTKTLTGIVVTSPGWGYSWAKATVSGGGKPDTCEIDCTVGDVSGGGLVKAGLGTLELSAENTYTGPTRVDAGTLRITAAGRIAAESPVVIAAGATLEVRNGQSFASVSGQGMLIGDVTETDFVADAAASSGVTIGGTLTVGENPIVTLRNLPANMEDESFVKVMIPVATATAYEGLENLADATFVGATLPEGVTAKFRKGASGLCVRVGRETGMTVILR